MNTINDIKSKNRVLGHHFFERATMRFFKSRVLSDVFEGIGGTYFVTSEQFENQTRRYTVRRMLENGEIRTFGEFNKLSRAQALREAKRASNTKE